MQLSQLSILLLLGSKINAAVPKDAVLLSQVRTLTLRADTKTSHRRVSAIPQLTCEGPGCAFYKVDLMRCKNQGSAYSPEDVEWSCTATIPREFKLGSTDVICEGYSNPNDKYILKGSCGVKYRLLLTETGEKKFGGYNGFRGVEWCLQNSLFIVTFIGILFWILYSAIRAWPAGNYSRRLGRLWGGGDGGGDGGYPWDPPPPYSSKRYVNDQQRAGWRPGFWTGALGGAAAGYMAGNRASGRGFTFPERRDGFLNETNRESSRSRISDSPRSTNYESTGFGSTSRR
ncbi:hypothetical protein EPUL_003369 [Erysiphe pulchra]|uniref:Store-operated calcium entry-associated regulatory factor n=1 Tax=Erysiphe pulchra TaxID=225359 RepID=A0A2S4PS20_9PEZI|nr:hypothetical protein EPUL_003369 [Erysiphe pulchra]